MGQFGNQNQGMMS